MAAVASSPPTASVHQHVGTVWLPTRPPVPAPPLLTAEETVLILRLKSIRQIQYYRKSGRLRAARVGKQYRYRLADVMRFIEEQSQ